jgi:hypothetical protein
MFCFLGKIMICPEKFLYVRENNDMFGKNYCMFENNFAMTFAPPPPPKILGKEY